MAITNPSKLVMVLMILALAPAVALAADAEAKLTVAQNKTAVTILDGDRPLVEYRYVDVPFKPYVARLFSPQGVQILRDAPRDHLHHHALMFGLSVDGVDCWVERGQCGFEKSESIRTIHGLFEKRPFAGLVETLKWTDHDRRRTLLTESRTIAVSSLDALRPVTLLNWQSKLAAPAGRSSLELGGAHYVGLGMRFVASMDEKGRFFNSSNKPGMIVRGEERLVSARWCAYTAEADKKRVTVAIFDQPKNPRHPNKFFTMTGRFAYLAVTLNLAAQPLKIESDKPLSLHYGVALWDGEVKSADVEATYSRWLTTTTCRNGSLGGGKQTSR